MKALLPGLIYLVIAYILLVGFFYLHQQGMIYFPKPGVINPRAIGLNNVSLIHLTTSDGLKLNAWYHPAKQDKPTLLYFHGNYGHLSHRAFRIKPFVDAGFGVLLLGYRGYSDNKGHPTEQGLYKDARAAISYLNENHVANDCIVLFGVSIGSAVAVQIATENHFSSVVLQSPFTSLPKLGKHHYPFFPVKWLLKDRYESLGKIKKINTPLLVIHGARDKIVPTKMSVELHKKALEPKKLVIINHAGHNTMPDVSNLIMKFITEHRQSQC